MKHLFILLSVSLVIVSSCPAGQFKCKSGDCLPAALVCDFKNDCEDGSDEDFCGSCDFEHHSCGWNDTSSSSYRWMRQMANITLTPGKDHTTGSPWGHFMHADKNQSGVLSEAIMEYSVTNLAALGCQISFWYLITDESSLTSSTLKLTMVRGEAEADLLEISNAKTDVWENATAFIGNQPGGYKLRFTFSYPFNQPEDVMVDDITFEYCAEGDVPAGSDKLSCTFENDTCSWYHDHTSSLFWERNERNGPAGKGYYMYITAANNRNISSAARLLSYPQRAGQVICVSFWYHIFGNNIGSLKFIVKRPDEPETVVWIRSGTQGNKRRFADLTFTSEKPIQFIIEAVTGGNHGSISIGNIVVSSSVNGSCPAERECTFQGSLCGLQTQPSADFSWSRITGRSQPANSSGPAVDHTLGTEQGYYLSAQLWRHPVGSRGRMMTAVMEPTPAEGECLMFWYYMSGKAVGQLSVYLQSSPADPPVQLWTRRGGWGNRWRHGRVTLLNSDTPYQVIFEAEAGNGPRRDIAIDDLIVLNGVCPPEGFCDFEMDFCGWVNNPPAESGEDWDWLSGASEGTLVPNKDHTTDSDLGHFVFYTAEQGIAQLESELIEPVDRACLEFWHYTEGWLSEGPSAINLTVFVNETSGLRPVMTINGYMNKTWFRDRVEYSSSGPHQVILQASCTSTSGGSLALDDVHILVNKSCIDIIPTTTPSPATTTTAAPASSMDCSFEQDLCNWIQEVGDDVNWTLSSGLQVEQPWDGPQYDHTVGNYQGVYLLLNGSGSKDGEIAGISVPVNYSTSPVCVGFWYYMLGPSVSTLNLLVKTKYEEVLVWTRRGTQIPEWINTQVTISVNDTMRVMFTGHRNTNSHGFIAIDDIAVREGACSNQNVCGFDSSSCGFDNDVSHVGRWGRKRGSKHHVDHTYGTENGFYMTVLKPNSTESVEARLLTPEVASSQEMCIRFWYRLPAESSNILTVHVLRSGVLGEALWSGMPSTGWEVAEVTVSSPAKFHVAFRAVHVPGMNSAVQIDDFSARDGACSPSGSCDFESGQCNWINVPKEDGHDWVLANGGFQGPPTDHTTHTPEGWFLLSLSQHQTNRSLAQVASEWIKPNNSTSCLTLWYHMESSDSGMLRVYMRSGTSQEEQLMFNSNSSGHTWTRFSQSIGNSEPFQLLIEAEANNTGFIAIDDINLTPGLCQVNETGLGFVGCTFENGTCEWEDISVGQYQWMRGRNATGNTGPSFDNTLGTQFGWYMAVVSYLGDQISPAALLSPTMKQAGSTCTLHFYYNMYGEDNKALKVLLKEHSRTTTLWWKSGNHGDAWQHGEVTVGRSPQDFAILFEASRTFNKPGHIAIDDIDFTNCSLPEPQPLCPENMFRCNNSVCVERNQVCDFSDDCGDWSDEKNCEQQGVVERCSFEQGLCSWAESEVDTPGAKWTRGKGQDTWPNQGPPRDHTRNSAAGHYIIPGTHLAEKGQTSEILSNTLLPSSDCTMRFFYYSLGDETAGLTAQSRTIHSGFDDNVLWLRGNSESYSWQRAEVTFSSSVNSKIVFRYERSDAHRGLVALDDISFSKECVFDPANSELPDTSPTSAPSTSSPASTSPAVPLPSTTPTKPCQDNEFFCWRSAGKVCIPAGLQCDYHPDCPQREDEDGCGPCTFEHDQCQWSDTSDGQRRWQRQKAGSDEEPPTDHTTGKGFYMRVNFSQVSPRSEALLQSPSLPPASPYCQLLFHFYISPQFAGSLRVLMQQADGSEAILWSRRPNTVSHWTSEYLPLGPHQQPYKIWFSSLNELTQGSSTSRDQVIAVDDFSFLNCEKSFQPPDLSAYRCSFEVGLCSWVQGAEGELDWLSNGGPTETPNTGPFADHTNSKGKYLYIESSPPRGRGDMAQLKSLLLPPAGEKGYCFMFWYHMFGATVGSLRMFLQTADPWEKTLVWQKSGNQGDEWLLVQRHMTSQKVHQVILEATVGGEAGDIAIDDISLISGPCPVSDLCDFEEGSCDWQQQTTDDADWVRHSGSTPNPNTGPDSDHTTNTPTGHYYYLPSSTADRTGQTAVMVSPLYPAGKGACVQLWYHMYGEGMGILNIYQQSEGGERNKIFSQTGDQGQLWRIAEASLLPQVHPYRIVVEGVKAGATREGDMAFDDVQLTDARCPPAGRCDFEVNMCSWSNIEGGVDQGDWLRSKGASQNLNTGPSVDHTTNSTHGYYLYVDSSVGQSGDTSFLISDVHHPAPSGHCLTFWYHMLENTGTLRVHINDRKIQSAGNEEGILQWTEAGDKGDKWHQARVSVEHKEDFWFVFVYHRGRNTGGDVALDDITTSPGPCPETPIDPPTDNNDTLSVGLGVGLTLLAAVVISIFLFMRNRNRCISNQPVITDESGIDQRSVFDLYDCNLNDSQHEGESDFSFSNNLYGRLPQDATVTSSIA